MKCSRRRCERSSGAMKSHSSGPDSSFRQGFSLHCRSDRLLFFRGNLITCTLAGFLQVSSDRGPQQIRHIPDFDMPHLLSCTLEDALRIGEFVATGEAKIDVVLNYSDIANAILHPVCRAIPDGHDIHLHDVLAAGRHFFEHQLSQCDCEFLNSPVIWFE